MSTTTPVQDDVDLLFSIDVESLGLYGEGYAVGVSVFNWPEKKEIDSFYAACPMSSALEYRADHPSIAWLHEHVNPHLTITHENPKEMRQAFWQFYEKYRGKENVTFMADCGYPVEARFFADCVKDDLQDRLWKGPYPLHELGTLLMFKGEDPLKTFSRIGEAENPKHHPLADARQSARIWMHYYGVFVQPLDCAAPTNTTNTPNTLVE